MKTYEKESLLKSFTLFFSVQFIFLCIVMYQHYHKVLHEYDMHVSNDIMQCHLAGECTEFETISIDNTEDKKLHTFYKENEVYMLFKPQEDFIKISIAKEKYSHMRNKIQKHVKLEYALYFFILILESLLFALYAMRPLKRALHLNDEFVKDILHDFNTPLTAIKINLQILKKKFGKDDAIQRSDEAIANILNLQDNLHYFLKQSKLQNQEVNLHEIINNRILYFESLFPALSLYSDIQNITLITNKDVFIRIIDNILSNACKYNKEEGEVRVCLKKNILTIQDTGIGIKKPQEVFKRHYIENNKGIGIGLHVVKKLCDALHIAINVQSTVGVGSSFMLDLTNIRVKKRIY
ncbi:HAMP domain-containing histidine kinase [Sulfurimonas sp. SAG-AH-194-I05]|nr:HAMP domain-containing sensor histidine kinase [Sulfurimonas sp. SAG-AH-194-I05]MDF1874496.1 HAMP domain-containing histidine kinase [Sulfurimonas sp. SAG-AH-194-I05]